MRIYYFSCLPKGEHIIKYRSIKLWDSMGHMTLMEEMEDTFDISIDTPDVLAFSSYEKGMDILRKYGVDI